jgi:mannose-6-phosphate isomerase
MLYFSLRRLEFETSVEDNTNGRFHVLTLVDGERIRIRSIEHPERYFDAEFMDMVVVPADMGRYVIENLRTEPICVHKTMLKDGFDAE